MLGLFTNDELEREPTVAVVNERTCIGCLHCQRVCPYGAIEQREIRDRDGPGAAGTSPTSTPASARAAAPARPSARARASSCETFTDEQVYAEINALAFWE